MKHYVQECIQGVILTSRSNRDHPKWSLHDAFIQVLLQFSNAWWLSWRDIVIIKYRNCSRPTTIGNGMACVTDRMPVKLVVNTLVRHVFQWPASRWWVGWYQIDCIREDNFWGVCKKGNGMKFKVHLVAVGYFWKGLDYFSFFTFHSSCYFGKTPLLGQALMFISLVFYEYFPQLLIEIVNDYFYSLWQTWRCSMPKKFNEISFMKSSLTDWESNP